VASEVTIHDAIKSSEPEQSEYALPARTGRPPFNSQAGTRMGRRTAPVYIGKLGCVRKLSHIRKPGGPPMNCRGGTSPPGLPIRSAGIALNSRGQITGVFKMQNGRL